MLESSAAFLGSLLLSTALLPAQIPEEFTNLQIFPEDTPRAELIETMRQFSFALGVPCMHCHIGEDPRDLTNYDFASDEKESKKIARVMMQMVNEINRSHLPKTGRADPLEVQCATCHSGIRRPQSLRDKLLTTIRQEGVERAAAEYRELREEYYGRTAYDFGSGSLNSVTETLAREVKDLDAAERMIRLNIEFHPDSHYSHYLLAQVLADSGNRAGARAALERALELSPDSAFYKQALERLPEN